LNIFVTGRPGVGKTTVIQRTIDELQNLGYKHGGISTPEIRVEGIRVGFEIVNLATSSRGILAHIESPAGPRIGRYKVNLNDLRTVGVNAIEEAVKNADYVVIDEVGPMELLSKDFREAILSAIKSQKPVLGVIHWRMQVPLVKEIKSRSDVRIYEVTPQNRESLHRTLVEKIVESIKRA